MIKTFIDVRIKYPLFSSDAHGTWIFLDRFSKDTQISNFVKIRPVGAELFHADGQTDRHDKASSRFSKSRSNYPVVRVLSVALSHEAGFSLPCLSCAVLPKVQRNDI